MVSRILRVKLSEIVGKALENQSKAALASQIGISAQKLSSMINDNWEYITRDSIERVADYFQLQVNELFEFTSVPFWQPIQEAKRCTFPRGSYTEPKGAREVRIPRFDLEATMILQEFLYQALSPPPEFVFVDAPSEEELIFRSKNENCMVVGSPRSNPACEVLLSRFFNATPYDNSSENRRRIPFGFCWDDSKGKAMHSSLDCSDLLKDRGTGIIVKGANETFVESDCRSAEAFHDWETTHGVDCGLVFIANKPFGTVKNVKLVVLSGLSAIGTLAAASALVTDYRYLEPTDPRSPVYGVVQTQFSKRAHAADGRKVIGFTWIYRKGGHSPL
jgi:DNA-binding Xre family transcriptional regulator